MAAQQPPRIDIPLAVRRLSQPGLLSTSAYPTIYNQDYLPLPVTDAMVHEISALEGTALRSELPKPTKRAISNLRAKVICSRAPGGGDDIARVLEGIRGLTDEVRETNNRLERVEDRLQQVEGRLERGLRRLNRKQEKLAGEVRRAFNLQSTIAMNRLNLQRQQPLTALPVSHRHRFRYPHFGQFEARTWPDAATIAAVLPVAVLDDVISAYGLIVDQGANDVAKAIVIWVYIGGNPVIQ